MSCHAIFVAALREEIGLSGCPGLGGTRLLIQHLAPTVRYHHHPDPARALCAVYRNGSCDIRAPWDNARVLAHEAGHYLTRTSLAFLFRGNGWSHARLEGMRCEWDARAFERMWLAPDDELWRPDEELLEVSFLDLMTLTLRRQEVYSARW